MPSKERVLNALSHKSPDRVPVDFGSTFTTGILYSVLEQLRNHYGLEKEASSNV